MKEYVTGKNKCSTTIKKKNDKQIVTNYQPVSLLAVAVKYLSELFTVQCINR